MLRRVKKWLGIEGVKVELLIPGKLNQKNGVLTGSVRFSSINTQTVTSLHFKLIEKYSRGRRKSKLTDEYILSEKMVPVLIEVPAHEPVYYHFDLPFEMIRSKMDELEAKNFILKGLVKAAKSVKSVRSEYRLEVEADIVGTALNPFDRQVIELEG